MSPDVIGALRSSWFSPLEFAVHSRPRNRQPLKDISLPQVRDNVNRLRFMIHQAKDLSADQKAVIESLLGRRVREDETVSVRAIEAPPLSSERKHELAGLLRQHFAEIDARRKPGSAHEAEDVITEAMRSVRPGYRPRQ